MAFLPMIAMFVVFYFLMIRPQMKRAKEAQGDARRAAEGRRSGHRRRHRRPDRQARRPVRRPSRSRPASRSPCSAAPSRSSCPRARSRRCDASSPRPRSDARRAPLATADRATRRTADPPFAERHESLPPLEIRRHRRRARRRPRLHAAQLLSAKCRRCRSRASRRRSRSTPRSLATVEDALKAADIPYRGATLDATGIKVRFADPDTQLKAKDAAAGRTDPATRLHRRAEPAVVVAAVADRDRRAADVPRPRPARRRALPAAGRHEGGARQGGRPLHADIRTLLRDKKIRYAGVAREGNNVVVRFRDAAERAQGARTRSRRAIADLAAARRRRHAAASCASSRRSSRRRRSASRTAPSSRTSRPCATASTNSASPSRSSSSRAPTASSSQLPGVQDTARAKDILGRTATLEIRMVDEDPGALRSRRSRGQVPFGSDLFTERNGAPVLVKRQVVLTGDRINDAQPGFDQRNNEPAVHVNLDGTGARIFSDVTRENVGKRMAIVLVEKGKARGDHRAGDPRGNRRRRFQISGRMTTREANDIALLLRAGALAAPMEIIEERTVGPSLGAENIDKGFNSVIYGFVVHRRLHVRLLPAVRPDLDARAVGQPAAAGRDAVDAAGDADAARHRRDRAHARHGDRRQRADQRAHPRGTAQRRDAAGGDPRRLRARVGHDSRLERDDADRRHRAARSSARARCAASRSSTASAS